MGSKGDGEPGGPGYGEEGEEGEQGRRRFTLLLRLTTKGREELDVKPKIYIGAPLGRLPLQTKDN
ncbi:MAG: hypothetical protein Fur0025_03590 [Oscillatoriaceae cyanobacterium]